MEKSDHERVMEALEDRFYEKGQFSNAKDLAEWTGLSRSAVDSVIEDLAGSELIKVYEGKGLPTVYITKQMNNSLISLAKEPEWIHEYEFEEKKTLRTEVQDANDKIAEFQKLERLLFGGGTQLEESVEEALSELGFNPSGTSSEEDLEIEHQDHTYIVEIKGVSGQIKKKHITQLGGWLEKKIDEGLKAGEITGLLLGNPEKNIPPDSRGEPLTQHAHQYLNLWDSKFVSTVELYDIIKEMKEDGRSMEKTRQKFGELIK